MFPLKEAKETVQVWYMHGIVWIVPIAALHVLLPTPPLVARWWAAPLTPNTPASRRPTTVTTRQPSPFEGIPGRPLLYAAHSCSMPHAGGDKNQDDGRRESSRVTTSKNFCQSVHPFSQSVSFSSSHLLPPSSLLLLCTPSLVIPWSTLPYC